jgi:predicted Zn-dependent protease
VAAYEFALISKNESSRYFAQKAVSLFNSMKGDKLGVFDQVDALYLSNEWNDARAYLKKKLEKDPNNDDLLIYLALVEASLGHVIEAEKIF